MSEYCFHVNYPGVEWPKNDDIIEEAVGGNSNMAKLGFSGRDLSFYFETRALAKSAKTRIEALKLQNVKITEIEKVEIQNV